MKRIRFIMAISIIFSMLAVTVFAQGNHGQPGQLNIPEIVNVNNGQPAELNIPDAFIFPHDQNEVSKIGQLYLYKKDPTNNWQIDGCEIGEEDCSEEDKNEPWGKMMYFLSGKKFKFVFKGHNLPTNQDYTLMYYPDPWPGNGTICLGKGTTNDYGDIHILDSVDTNGDLPYYHPGVVDDNYSDDNAYKWTTTYNNVEHVGEEYEGMTGAKIWLVLSEDVCCDCVPEEPNQMIGWNPTEYLFEKHLINFEDTDD